MHPLLTAVISASTVGTILGSGFVLAGKLWIRRLNADIEEGKTEREEMEKVLADNTSRIIKIEYQLTEIDKLSRSVAAVHSRLDNAAREEAMYKEKIAERLGGLTSQIAATQDIPNKVYALIKAGGF